jgi:hypothetical protein
VIGSKKHRHARVAGQELGFGSLKQAPQLLLRQSVNLGVHPDALLFFGPLSLLLPLLKGLSLCERLCTGYLESSDSTPIRMIG